LRAVQEQIRAVRGTICGEGSDDEGAWNGLVTRRAMGGRGSSAPERGAADDFTVWRSGKNCGCAGSTTRGTQHHAYVGASVCAGDLRGRGKDLAHDARPKHRDQAARAYLTTRKGPMARASMPAQ